jgi:hypothetical protein
MRKTKLLAVFCIAFLLVFAYGCNKGAKDAETTEAGTQEHGEAGEHTHEGETEPHTHEGETAEHTQEGEAEPHTHEGETAEHTHEEEGEEAGPEIGLDGTHDEVRKGVRLILSFDSESSSFVGTVENVSEKTVSKVRVEVHLSNGTELGPTKAVDLAPGKKIEVKLSAVDQTFTGWKAHAEAGTSEH